MNIKPCPTGGMPESMAIEMVNENTLLIDGEDYIFTPGIVEFDPCGPILAANRDDAGDLWVTVHVLYSEAHRGNWESKDVNGQFRGENWEVWEVGESLYKEDGHAGNYGQD